MKGAAGGAVEGKEQQGSPMGDVNHWTIRGLKIATSIQQLRRRIMPSKHEKFANQAKGQPIVGPEPEPSG